MEYQDEISAFLDAENSITARWVANNLRTNLTKARNLLSLYKKAQPELSVSYLVAGINISGSVSYIVSDDVDLEGVRGQFSSIRSEEVYALHKRTSISNKAEIQALECDQASELLFMTHPNSADFYKNSIGCIVCPNVDIKPIGQRILSSKLTVSSQSVPEVRESIKTSINKTLPSAPAASVIKSKSSIQATNFFGAAVAKELKPAKDASAVQEEKPVVAGRSSAAILNSNETPDNASASAVVGAVVAAPAPASAKKVGKIVCDDDEDEEWDSGYKPDAARLKERVDAIAASSSNRISVGSVVDVADMDMTAEDEDGLEGAEGAGAGKTARKKGKHAVVKHGAMDDYMEDIAIAAHNKAEATPADAPKPKKRKLVEKVRRVK